MKDKSSMDPLEIILAPYYKPISSKAKLVPE